MIRFGSRTEVYLPLAANVLVKVGDQRRRWIDNHRTAPRFMNEQPSKIYLLPNLDDGGEFVLRVHRHAQDLEARFCKAQTPTPPPIFFTPQSGLFSALSFSIFWTDV